MAVKTKKEKTTKTKAKTTKTKAKTTKTKAKTTKTKAKTTKTKAKTTKTTKTKAKTTKTKTTKSSRTKTICISHKEDCDGISSAALIRQAFGGDAILVDYPGQMDALRQVITDEKLKSLYICDLGLSKKTQDEFIELCTTLRKNKVSVTYIDHHDIDPNVIKALEKIKVKVIHDINECASVQVYSAFKSKLSDHASFIATCAAITDYMEDRPIGAKLLQIYDRQFALISATTLTYNIVGHQKDPDYLLYLVEELADSKFPHEIPNTFEFAQIQVEKLSQMIAKVKAGLKTMKNLGYMEILDAGASGAVNFVLGLSGKEVGVAYKERVDHGIYAVSVRGSKSLKTHLGKIVNVLATDLGGSGGGHDKACGAVIPKPKIKAFIKELNKKLN
jgi:RecJ-like exonuclease